MTIVERSIRLKSKDQSEKRNQVGSYGSPVAVGQWACVRRSLFAAVLNLPHGIGASLGPFVGRIIARTSRTSSFSPPVGSFVELWTSEASFSSLVMTAPFPTSLSVGNGDLCWFARPRNISLRRSFSARARVTIRSSAAKGLMIHGVNSHRSRMVGRTIAHRRASSVNRRFSSGAKGNAACAARTL